MILLLNIATGYVFAQSPVDSTWQTFDTRYFSVQYPKGWLLDKSGRDDTYFILYARTKKDAYRNYVMFRAYNTDNGQLLLLPFVPLENGSSCHITGVEYKSVETKKLQNQLGDYGRLTYIGRACNNTIRFYTCTWTKNKSVYKLEIGIVQSEVEVYQNIIEGIINSFTIKQ